MPDLAYSCRCGTVTGTIRDAGPDLSQGTRCRCRCASCRDARLYLGEDDPEPLGVDLYQTNPQRVSIDTGQEYLAAFRVTPKGSVIRVYADCCRTTLFTTAQARWAPLMSVAVPRIDGAEVLGPVRATAFIPKPEGGSRTENMGAFMGGLLARLPDGWRNGGRRNHPLFDDDTGRFALPVRVMTKAERQALPPRRV